MYTVITKEVYRYLANHTCELQDNKIRTVNVFAKDFDVYMSTLDFINSYISRMDSYLDKANTGEGPHKLPFVILGSVVYASDLNNGKVYKYKIDMPDKKPQRNDMSTDIKNVSCFSPAGSALLFKELNDEVMIEAENKKLAVKIEEIDFELTW